MSQITPELRNAIVTIGTHRVIWRAQEEERKRRELLREEMIQENLVNQSTASNEIANPTPRYPNHSVENLFPYDRNIMTPTPINTIAPDQRKL
jgi:hypothetical protein